MFKLQTSNIQLNGCCTNKHRTEGDGTELNWTELNEWMNEWDDWMYEWMFKANGWMDEEEKHIK